MKAKKPFTTVISIGAVAATVGALCLAVTGFTGSALRVATPSGPTAACTAGTLVRTADGPVCGTTNRGVTSYRGIRYAAPPVGALRWQPPHPVTHWTTTFPATSEGNICAGPSQTSDEVLGSEDCLNLDVQIPVGTTSWQRLPVLVQIHGGGFLDPVGPPDGSHLVTAGRVVYVAMNYRLGILGFMANKALGPHSGDYGLQDQQAALRWVQDNIARFGGNPRNVTIIGNSAGGASVCDQVASPTARGLFTRGIAQSGFFNAATGPQQVWEASDCKSQIPTQRQADQAGANFARKVGCTPSDVACLRALPASTLVEAGGRVNDPSAGGTSATMAPTINGTTLPMSAALAFRTGHINHVAGLMIGVGRDEFNGFGSVQSPAAYTPAQFRQLIRRQYGRLAPAVERLYPLARFPSPYIAYRTVVADSDSVCSALRADRELAPQVRVFAYEDDDASMPYVFPPFLIDTTQPNGAYHMSAYALLYLSAAVAAASPNQAALVAQFTTQVTGYARTGNPTVPGTPLWTRYTTRNRQVMSLVPAGDSALTPAGTIAAQHQCAFWDAVTPTASR